MGKGGFIIRFRWPIIIVTLLLVVASAIPLTGVKINSDLESYLPATIAPKVNTDKIGEVFGNNEMMLLVFESEDVLNPSTLKRIRDLGKAFGRMKEFDRVISLFDMKNITGKDGAMIVDPVVQSIPETPVEREALRKAIRENDMVYKFVVAGDFKSTLIILSAGNSMDDATLMHLVDEKLAAFPGSEKVSINGQPFMRDEANRKIGHDVLLLLPIGLVVMFFFLWASFREMRGVLLPFSVVVFSIILALGLIPLFRWELSIIGVLVPIMMIAIANNYGVYFITRYQELNARYPGITMPRIAVESYSYLKTPVLLCGLTTIAGVMGLVVHVLKPASQMGIVTGIAIGFALSASLLFIPAVMSLLRKGKVQKTFLGMGKGPADRVMRAFAHAAVKRPGRVVLLFAIFMVAALAGLTRFRTASDHHNILPRNHSYNRSLDILNRHFGGSKVIYVMFKGDIKDPALLNNLDRYEKTLEKTPGIGSVTSIATVIRKMSMALNDPGDRLYDRIPDTRDAVAQYIELYSMSGEPGDFEDIVDFDYTSALMTIQFQASNMKETDAITGRVSALVQDDPNYALTGGYSLIDREICTSVVTGQYQSLLLAFTVILLLLAVIFRSMTAGLLGSLPLAFAVICTFGIMGWTNIELNIVTALLSSVSIGLGVDFTIQMFWKLKTEIAAGRSCASAVSIALKTMGRGISINAFSVMLGFSILFLSAFPLIRSFAFLIIISLFLCLACALLLMPAICMLLRPGFLGPYPAEKAAGDVAFHALTEEAPVAEGLAFLEKEETPTGEVRKM